MTEFLTAVFDGIGGDNLWRSRDALREGGRVVTWSPVEPIRADLDSDCAFLPKPFLPDALLKTIGEVLDARSMPRQFGTAASSDSA